MQALLSMRGFRLLCICKGAQIHQAFAACVLQVDSHLLAELQVVLADKAALEEEKAAAQVRGGASTIHLAGAAHLSPYQQQQTACRRAGLTSSDLLAACDEAACVWVLQAEAAAAQRAFEHSHAMLEGQLSQLSSAISSQEALIATLQANEAEAKNLGALYLVGQRSCQHQQFAVWPPMLTAAELLRCCPAGALL
jgi:hypothetical protein